jgi:hypothetical protein
VGRRDLRRLPIRRVAWSPDGKWLAIVDGSVPRSHLWVVRANGYGLKRLL